jgi:PAS domain S-box-containing protein
VWGSKLWRGRKQTNEREEGFARILRGLGHGVIVVDVSGLIAFMNPVAGSITGWENKDAVGRPLKEIFTLINKQTRLPIDLPISADPLESQVSLDQPILLAKGGVEKRLDFVGVRIKANEKVVGIVLSFRDLSARERDQEERWAETMESLKRRLKTL